MAEVAIPIVALGAMYIISNKKEKKIQLNHLLNVNIYQIPNQ